MSHVRQQLRDAAVAALTGLTTTGARVYPSRLLPLRDTDLPCLLVTTDNEDVLLLGVTDDGTLERTLTLMVRCAAKMTGALDDTLDTMVAEVETALAGQTLGGKAHNLQLTSIAIDMDDVLEKPAGIAVLNFTATYYTAAGSPGTAL